MTYIANEWSLEEGRPIRLYRFSLGDKFWYYTSADGDVQRMMSEGGVMKMVTFLAVPISDDGINQTGESTSDALTITSASSITPSQLYAVYPPATPVQVALLDTHEGDMEVVTIYMGEITGRNEPNPGTTTFTVETVMATLSREGLRLGWQRACPYALYDPVTCRVNKALWAKTGPVTAISENTIDLPAAEAYADRRCDGGFIEWTDPVRGIERRAVETHVGARLVLYGVPFGLTVGMAVTVYPGCARTTDACAEFNNLGNYGGAPSLQGKSPFDGTPVFN